MQQNSFLALKTNLHQNPNAMLPSTISLLSEDLITLAKLSNPQIELLRLTAAHSDPLVLKDNTQVLPISKDDFIGVFDYQSDHYFLSDELVFRVGSFFNLDPPNIIALMLKSQWELFYFNALAHSGKIKFDFASELKNVDSISEHIGFFEPSVEILLNATSLLPKKNVLPKPIKFYYQDLMVGAIFLQPNSAIHYSGRPISEKTMLDDASEFQRATYHDLKQLWLFKSSDFDENLFLLERKKKINLGIEGKYFRSFNSLETAKGKLTYSLEKYKMILNLIPDHPDLSFKELVLHAKKQLVAARQARSDLRDMIARSSYYIDLENGGGSLSSFSSEFRNKYSRDCKKLIRKLFFLLHPDTSPDYLHLSKKNKKTMDGIWLDLMKCTKNEVCSFAPSMMLYSLPDLDHLQALYQRVCGILEIDPEEKYDFGIDRLDFLIRKGTPLEELLEFFKSEMDRIELHMANIELIQLDYTNETKSQFYQEALGDVEGHSLKLQNEISQLKQQIADIKHEIRAGLQVILNN